MQLDYSLLDSGNGMRLEKFGAKVLVRPDANVLWEKSDPANSLWEKPDAIFDQTGWQVFSDLEDGWIVSYGKAKFKLSLSAFRHVGIFPEQEKQWFWMSDLIDRSLSQGRAPKVLNLFAYTGAASVICAMHGASVCHVEAVKGHVSWAKENAKLSKLSEDSIRWIVEDVRKFVKREIRRGSKYDLIIMDPPVFGRGSKGEIWRLEREIADLATMTAELLSDKPLGVLVNLYATSLYPESVRRLFEQSLKSYKLSSPRLEMVSLEEKKSGKQLCTGYSILVD